MSVPLCECLHAKRAHTDSGVSTLLTEWSSGSFGQRALYEMRSRTKIAVPVVAVKDSLHESCSPTRLECMCRQLRNEFAAILHGIWNFCLFSFSACDRVSHLQLSDLELPHNKKCKVTRLAASWVCLRAQLELQHSEELELRQGTELWSGAAWEIKASCCLRGWCD